MNNTLQKLAEAGQSLWYDNIQRHLLENGDLKKMIDQGQIRGVTSNPSIFHSAIAKSTDYDMSLLPMAWSGWSAEQIFDQLAIEDIRQAADLFLPLYQQTGGADGFVSIEVNPFLAKDKVGTLSEAKRLWATVNRPNLMVKIPATHEGLPAIRDAIAAGINVNITLIFSRVRYNEVMDAYQTGLELRVKAGQPVDKIASVASFFVSRIDGKADARLQEIQRSKGEQSAAAGALLGKTAIANAKLAYVDFQKQFSADRFKKLAAKGAKVQRPLWASTSTKNPNYPDVLYLDELIGKDTVNTVPPQTLVSFLDHGQVRNSLTEDVPAARADLQALEKLGISLDEITAQLEEDGVKSFSDAFTELLKTIEERRQKAVAALGGLAAPIAARVHALDKMDVPRRLWAHDPSLWAETEVGQVEVRKRLGWLEAPQRSRTLLADANRLFADVRNAGYTHVLLLGMGGSSLAPEVFSQVFGMQATPPQNGQIGQNGLALQILDSTDPSQIRAASRWSDVESTLYIISSKSGSTSEVNAALDYFWARAHRKLGDRAAEHFIAITDPGTSLETLARERKFRAVFLADPTVGGRYSALTAFGLVPATLMGLDAAKILDRAAWMAAQCAADIPAGCNPGLVLGAILGEAFREGHDKLTLLTDSRLTSFGSWMEQLIAESSGKEGKGIVPVDLEPALPADQYGADRLFAALRVQGEDGQAVEKRTAALAQAGQPVLSLTLRDTYDLGAQFFLWGVATVIACATMGINAFDQPDVQDNKTRTATKVKAFQQTRALDDGQAIWEGAGGRVYGWNFPGLNGAKTLADVVRSFIEQSRENEYIAINAYVPRNPRTLSRLQQLRGQILRSTRRATTLGFGPRFLHSTGQLHKGGANNGLFLQITQRPTSDAEIPGQKMMFGTLERAQALGDLETLLARGKRAIRIHLVDGDLKDLLI